MNVIIYSYDFIYYSKFVINVAIFNVTQICINDCAIFGD